jgi:hypothetical protein
MKGAHQQVAILISSYGKAKTTSGVPKPANNTAKKSQHESCFG